MSRACHDTTAQTALEEGLHPRQGAQDKRNDRSLWSFFIAKQSIQGELYDRAIRSL